MKTADRMDETLIEVPRGLANVVVAETALSEVRGMEGFYHYRGYPATELARHRSVEDVWALLLDGELPDEHAAAAFSAEVAAASAVSSELADRLRFIGESTRATDVMGGLRAAVALEGARIGLRPVYDLSPAQRRRQLIEIAAKVPGMIAALSRARAGHDIVAPRPELGYVANYLYQLHGEVPAPERVTALSAYLVAAIDHGLNASTFTARVIASTGADVASCLTGALGALSGPLHGGAPSRVLDTLDAIGSPANIDNWVIGRLTRGERIMGFGHPVYRTEDPRSALLKEVARGFGGQRVELAIAVEERIPALLDRYKPGRVLRTNVEWYAAIVMELCGLSRELFTPTFAVARVLGWTANILEQSRDPKIIRPASRYVGPTPPLAVPDATPPDKPGA